MQVAETLPDKPLPTAFVYEDVQGGRLKGVQMIADVLGGIAVPNSLGALEVLPKSPTVVVGELVIGPEGTVTDVPYSLETEGVYNCVVGTFEDENRVPIRAVAAIAEGTLATNSSGYGEYTRYYSSPLVNTQAEADKAVWSILNESIGSQQYEVPIQCITNPLVELGDLLKVVGHVRPLQGQLVRYVLSNSALMTVTLEVARDL
jgi:hypothetical protein